MTKPKLFRTVPVSERLPEKKGWYVTFLKGGDNQHFILEWIGHWNDDGQELNHITHWLEEYELPSEDQSESSIGVHKAMIENFDLRPAYVTGFRDCYTWFTKLILNPNRK